MKAVLRVDFILGHKTAEQELLISVDAFEMH